MTWHPAFEAAAQAAAHRLGSVHLRVLADRLGAGWPEQAVRHAVPVPGFAEVAAAVLTARSVSGLSEREAAAYLRGLAAGHAQRSAATRVESVWSGPSTHPVPVRATAQVLTSLARSARTELLLMTYSATPYRPLLRALTEATARGVAVTVVVETVAGGAGALHGAEPAAAFADVPGVELWHWPVDRRSERPARMHAKIAVADRHALLVSSANLTQSGATRNIEAGLLVHGGSAPLRAAEHIAELQSRGVLTRLGAVG
ncbi:DISARM system phospholipase D-like protein DrmC [Micromonospora sp. SH-82]|uniref:DISARM system phospholipase D-like protein DrmC n=1 Tax=Micromonospora sp. SH-82 TaxID=3132938 RepID=UPI003EB8249F